MDKEELLKDFLERIPKIYTLPETNMAPEHQ